MEVSTARYWFRENNTSCVDGLPDLNLVASTSNFFDKDGRQTFATKSFVYTKKVNLGAFDNIFADSKVHRNTGYESD